jgi:two-component system sensor histidine kinase KdpD
LLLATLLTLGLAFAGLALPDFGTANLALLLMLPVVVAAAGGGRRLGMVVALLAGAAFNYVALEPRQTFHIANASDVLTLAIYLLVALFTASVAARLAEAGERARAEAAASAEISELAQRLLLSNDPANIIETTASAIAKSAECRVQVVETPEALALTDATDEAAARWALAHRDKAGRGTSVMPSASAYYVASRAGRRALLAQVAGDLTDSARVQLFRTFLDEAADTLDRTELAARIEADARAAQTETMRKAIFASIGHDLRTPMTSLRAGLELLQGEDKSHIETMRADALRLERTLENLLDLARLQANAIAPERVAVDLTDAISSAVDALPSGTRDRVTVSIVPETPLVQSDAVMLHHVVLNLIENAAKYSSVDSGIEVRAAPIGETGARLSVADRGPGLGEAVEDLFSLFRRGGNADSVPGSGVGLSVVDAFARALGHQVTANDRDDGPGTEFTVIFEGRSQ